MSYFLKKTSPSKKGEYLQIYETIYIPGKGSRNHSYKKLGYTVDLKKQGINDPISYAKKLIDKLNEDTQEGQPQIGEVSTQLNMGYFLLKSMIDNLKIDKDIELMTSNRKFQYKVSDFIRSMIYAQVIDPGSKHRAFERVIPNIYGCSKFSYDQILDGVNYLGNDYQKYIELFNHHIQDKYPRVTDKVYFDCTNYYFEIDLEDDIRRKGPSKENRKSPIIGQALLLDGEQIPLAMTLYPGNESEKPQLRKHIEDIKERYDVKGRVVQVADKGLNCAMNIYAAIREANDGYIFSKSVHGKNLSSSERNWVLLDNEYNIWHNVIDKNNRLRYRYKEVIDKYEYSFYDSDNIKQTFTVKEKRIVTYNPKLASKKRNEILKEVEKVKTKLTIKGIAREEFGDGCKYVEFDSKDNEGKKIKIQPKINETKINEDLEFAGYNLLVTSEIEKSAEEIYDIYHGLWKIEESFRIMKTYLEARPIFLQTKESIYGHFLICYLALTTLRLLERKVFKDTLSSAELIDFIRDYNVTSTTGENYINNAARSSIYTKIKETLGLSKLGNLYLTKRNLDNLLTNVDLNTLF